MYLRAFVLSIPLLLLTLLNGTFKKKNYFKTKHILGLFDTFFFLCLCLCHHCMTEYIVLFTAIFHMRGLA